MQANRASPFLNVVQVFADAWRSWRERRARLIEFDTADPGEMQRMAADLRVSVSELRDLAGRDKHAADLLQCRLQSLKLNPSEIPGDVMRDLQRCCSRCQDKALCQHELEDQPYAASWPEYCPNEETIRAIATEKEKGAEAK
jgi:hypothetical protein